VGGILRGGEKGRKQPKGGGKKTTGRVGKSFSVADPVLQGGGTKKKGTTEQEGQGRGRVVSVRMSEESARVKLGSNPHWDTMCLFVGGR